MSVFAFAGGVFIITKFFFWDIEGLPMDKVLYLGWVCFGAACVSNITNTLNFMEYVISFRGCIFFLRGG